MDIDEPEASTSCLKRLEASSDPLEPLSSAFVIEKAKPGSANANAFRSQYASVYFSRLMALKKVVKENAERKWKDVVKKNPSTAKTQRVLDIGPGALCFVIGTIYMEMRLKPNILEDLSREQYIAAPPPRAKFLSDDDEVMLEDESGRVRLVGKVIEERKFSLVTGVIAAVLGAENASGDFEVVDMCFAGLPPQPSSALSQAYEDEEDEDERTDDPYVAIVSGLELGTSETAADYRVGLLTEWLLGESGSDAEKQLASQVTRLILAGNSMCQPVRTGSVDTASISVEGTSTLTAAKDKKPRKTYGYDSSSYSAAPTAQLDEFLQEILESLDVDIMSGEKDPNGTTLPQQPLHEALLPAAGAYKGFKRQTNPFWSEIAGRSFLGTAGQNIDDIFKYLPISDRLSMACSTLEFSHMAPTAPDTLFCYPFQDRDPFILTRTPNVYFIGNQPMFETKLLQEEGRKSKEGEVKCRVVLVPKFVDSGEIVLVNCRTLKAKTVGFA